jgi:8-oxo-dGTP diphosphatase
MIHADDPIPAFGERLSDRDYVPRPGAYALIADRGGRIAIVLSNGRCYLPGGGVEPGESLDEALRREVREECGLRIDRLTPLGTADEYVYASGEGVHYQKRCTFFAATVTGTDIGAIEAGCEMRWLTPAEALRRLEHGSHAWAVERYSR